jgi:hypothetical protein
MIDEFCPTRRRATVTGLTCCGFPLGAALGGLLADLIGLLIIYALTNWMPILLKDAGLSLKSATLISALFPLGGVGAVPCGALMDRFNANLVIAACHALGVASLSH